MTKKINPTARYDAHSGYPTFEDEHASRRDFLRRTLGGAALSGAVVLGATVGLGTQSLLSSLLGGEAEARAGTRRGRKYYPVWISLFRRHYFSNCLYQVDRLLAQTRDRRLAAFLGDAKETAGIIKVVLAELSRAVCEDLTNQKRLARLHRRLGRALAAHYRKRRRRTTAAPVVILEIRRRVPPLPGRPPVPRPPHP